MSQSIDLGRLRFYHRGAYASGTTYELNDVVSYGGASYVYIYQTNASGNVPTNTTYWAKLADGLDNRSAWVTSTAYYPGDVVTRGGTGYVCLLAHTSGTFTTDLTAAKWEVLASGFNWRNTWATSTLYFKNDVVFINGNAYIATTEFTSNATSFANDANWQLFSEGGTGEIPNQAGYADNVLKTNGTAVAWTNSLTLVSSTFSGNVTANNVHGNTLVSSNRLSAVTDALIGSNASTLANSLTNPIVAITTNKDDYAQLSFKNYGTNANSSSDFIAYADVGNDTAGWIDVGITSANFSDPSFTVTGAHDGYIFVEAPVNSAGNGNLILATGGHGAQNKIIFAAGGLQSSNTQMVITPDTSVYVNINTNSTSSTTGAFVVAGGMGVGGNVYIQGNTSIQGTITVGGGAFESNNLTVSDPIIFTANSSTGDTFDLGFASKYVQSNTAKYAGLLRDASDSKFYLFENLTTIPTTTANFAASSPATLSLGSVNIQNNTAASSTTTGALTVAGGVGIAGNAYIGGNATVTGDTTVSGNLAVTGSLILNEISEITAQGTITTNTLTVAYSTGLISYVSSPSANFAIDLTGVPTTNDRLISFTAVVTQGATGYIPNTFKVDGTSQTIKWSGGSAPTPTSSSGKIDIFSFNLLRTSNAWTVFGSSSLNY